MKILSGQHNERGTVYIIPQIHADPMQNNGSWDHVDHEVVASQQYVLDALMNRGAIHVFPESYAGEKFDVLAELRKLAVQKFFKGYFPGGTITDQQGKILFRFGAASVYSDLPSKRHVALHKTVDYDVQLKGQQTARTFEERMAKNDMAIPSTFENADDLEKVSRYFAKKNSLNEQLEHDVITARDNDCVKYICKFMEENPTKDAYVVMGAKHDLVSAIRERSPEMPVKVLDEEEENLC